MFRCFLNCFTIACKSNKFFLFKPQVSYFCSSSTSSEKETIKNDNSNCLETHHLTETNKTPWTCWWEKKSFGSHPGVCNLPAVSLPSQVIENAKVFLKPYDKAVLAVVSQKLDDVLFSRRVCAKKQTLVKQIKKKERNPIRPFKEDQDLPLVNLSYPEYKTKIKERSKKEKEKNRYTYDWKKIVYDELNAASYLLCRSPACYAVSLRVLSEIKKKVPDFNPASILDFGSGTGMSVWAANSLWKDSLKQYLCIDSSEEMNNLSFFLFSGGNYSQTLPGMFIRRTLPVTLHYNYDIVISAYSLSELPSEKERLALLKILWEKTQRYLVLIENGNFHGYYIMIEARNLLLNGLEGANIKNSKHWSKFNKSATVFSPCPHDQECPKWADDSCVFSQKYFQPEYFNHIFKDSYSSPSENFTYMVFEKNSNQSCNKWPRIVSNLQSARHCVGCKVCTPEGNLEHLFISKKSYGSDLYFVAKKSKLGDSLPINPTNKSDD